MEIDVAKKTIRSAAGTESPGNAIKAGKKAGDSKKVVKKKGKKAAKKSSGTIQKGGKPGRKAMVPRKGETIFATKKAADIWYRDKFLGKGTKNTKEGLKNPWLNVQTEDGKVIEFKENDIEWLYGTSDLAPVSIKTFVNHDNQIHAEAKMLTDDKIGEAYVTFIPQKYWNYPFVKEAKERELAKFEKFLVYKVVKDDKNYPFITSGWVITEKFLEGKMACKARLVVHGNQIVDNIQTDSPTVRKLSLRILFALALQYGRKVKNADVTSAFLRLHPLDRDVYVKPPADIHMEGTLWKLRVAVYGLGEAWRECYATISDWLIKIGMIKTETDPALFYYVKKGRPVGILALHVDDALYVGSAEFDKDVIKPMMAGQIQRRKSCRG